MRHLLASLAALSMSHLCGIEGAEPAAGGGSETTTAAPTGQTGTAPTGQQTTTPGIDIAAFTRSQAEHAQERERFKAERAAFDAQRKELEPTAKLRERIAQYKDAPELALDDLNIDYAALTKRMAGRPTASPEALQAKTLAEQTQQQLRQLQYQTAVSGIAARAATLLEKSPLAKIAGVTADQVGHEVLRLQMAGTPKSAEQLITEFEAAKRNEYVAAMEADPGLYTEAEKRKAAREAAKATEAAAAAKAATKGAAGVIPQSAQTTPAAGGVKLTEAERKARAIARLKAGKEAK